jgi:activator of HSP90 ATPase
LTAWEKFDTKTILNILVYYCKRPDTTNFILIERKEEQFMTTQLFTRRDFSLRLASLFPALGVAGTVVGSAAAAANGVPAEEISHTAESIHQEIVIKASRKRVYEALTDGSQFTKLTDFTDMKGSAPANISREVGGSFSCFGGHIVGRHVELLPNQRIVQAWRVVVWKDGVYSIAKFDLKEEGADTRVVFDHTGFPTGQGEHLAGGWKEHYWEPLAKYLA